MCSFFPFSVVKAGHDFINGDTTITDVNFEGVKSVRKTSLLCQVDACTSFKWLDLDGKKNAIKFRWCRELALATRIILLRLDMSANPPPQISVMTS